MPARKEKAESLEKERKGGETSGKITTRERGRMKVLRGRFIRLRGTWNGFGPFEMKKKDLETN